ncbi:MAG: glycosyltransferase family 9 protein [bacterium]
MPLGPGGASDILVVRLSSFGDVVLAEPAVRELARAFPAHRIGFASHTAYAAIPTMFAGVGEVVEVPRPDHPGSRRARGPEGDYRVIVDLQNSLRSRAWIRSLRAERVLRYSRPWARRLVCVYLPWLWKGQLEHTVDLYLKALRPLGVNGEASAPRLAVPDGARSDAIQDLGDGPWVGVCPGGSSPHKMWPADRFAELARRLVASGHKVVALGSEADRSQVEAVLGGAGGRGVAGFIRNDPVAVAAALSLCVVTVSNDSGLMHLAEGVGSRVVGIFGPTSPLLGFAPLSPDSAAVSRHAPCSPCSYHGNRPCRYRSPFCLEEIQPSDVASIVDRLAGRSA